MGLTIYKVDRTIAEHDGASVKLNKRHTEADTQIRFYVTDRPILLVLELQNGILPSHLRSGTYFEAFSSTISGGAKTGSLVLVKKQRHTKLTVTNLLMASDVPPGLIVTDFSAVLENAPKEKKNKRARPGRPFLKGKERAKKVNITLTPDDWALADTLGNGNVSAGIRSALRGMQKIAPGQHINNVQTWDINGKPIDVLTFADGRVLVVQPEGEALYDNEQKFWDEREAIGPLGRLNPLLMAAKSALARPGDLAPLHHLEKVVEAIEANIGDSKKEVAL